MTQVAAASESGARVIRASAGTGKTHRLGQRYFRLLQETIPPDRILATTFTRKAAGEIQARILGKLAKASLGNPESLQFIPGLTMDAARRMLTHSLDQLHRLSIGTLDSFFMQIARSWSLDLDMPPTWDILDDVDNERIQDEAICAMLNDSAPQRMIDLLRMLNPGIAKYGVHSQILNVVRKLHKLYTQQPARSAWSWLDLGPVTGNPPTAQWVTVLDRLEKCGIIPRNQDGSPSITWENGIKKNIEDACREDWLAFISVGLAKKILSGEAKFGGKEIPIELIDAYQPMLDYTHAVLLGQISDRTRSAYELLKRFDAHYSNLKSDKRLYRFEDITHNLVGQLPTGRMNEIYYRLDGRIDHLLLDEFQDTSLDQWKVLRPIADELRSAEGRSLFVVGDVKQAIYGWRGGDAEIFSTLEQQFHAIEQEELFETYRCRQAIVTTVNWLFTRLQNNPGAEKIADACEQWAEGFKEHQSARKDLEGYAEFRVAQSAAEGVSQRNSTLAQAARFIHDIQQKAPGRSIGVLVQQNQAVARMIYELRRLGILASEEGGNSLNDSPGVSLILSLLRLADHPGDSAAAFHVASSPLGDHFELAHDNPMQVLPFASQVRRLLDEGYGKAIQRWVEILSPHCDERALRRLMQLLELAHRYEATATLRPCDFVRRVEQEKIDDPASSAVRVMTLHKAKGLGFDIVILPQLDEKLVQVQRDWALTDRPGAMEAPSRIVRYVSEQIRTLDDQLVSMHKQAVRTKAIEELSVLYVMLTRAKYALYGFLAPSKLTQKGTETFPSTFGGILRGASEFGAQPVSEGQIIFQTGDPHWFDDPNLEPVHVTAQEPPETIEPRLKASSSNRSRMIPRTTPSGLERGKDRGRPFTLFEAGAAGRAFGTRVHELLAQIDWITDHEIHEDLHEYLKQDAIRRLLSRDSYPADLVIEVSNEESFLVRFNNQLVRGNIDRLIVMKRGADIVSAEVIDWKTDSFSAETLHEKVESYRPQIEIYGAAVAQTYQLDPSKITCKLAFLSSGQVKTI